jgi:hypothetical protein
MEKNEIFIKYVVTLKWYILMKLKKTKLVMWCNICKTEHEIDVLMKDSDKIFFQGRLCLNDGDFEDIHQVIKKKFEALRIIEENSIEEKVRKLMLPVSFDIEPDYSRDYLKERMEYKSDIPMTYRKETTGYRV